LTKSTNFPTGETDKANLDNPVHVAFTRAGSDTPHNPSCVIVKADPQNKIRWNRDRNNTFWVESKNLPALHKAAADLGYVLRPVTEKILSNTSD
jgi:hypothetical protein